MGRDQNEFDGQAKGAGPWVVAVEAEPGSQSGWSGTLSRAEMGVACVPLAGPNWG